MSVTIGEEKPPKVAGPAAVLSLIALCFIFDAPLCHSQAKAEPSPDPGHEGVAPAVESANPANGGQDAEVPPAIAKELEAMKRRIGQLEEEPQKP